MLLALIPCCWPGWFRPTGVWTQPLLDRLMDFVDSWLLLLGHGQKLLSGLFAVRAAYGQRNL